MEWITAFLVFLVSTSQPFADLLAGVVTWLQSLFP